MMNSFLIGIANVHTQRDQFQQAREIYKKNLMVCEELGEKRSIALALRNIGYTFFRQGQFDSAFVYASSGVVISQEVGDAEGIKSGYELLSAISAEQLDFANAYEYHMQYTIISDSLLNETNIKSINEMQAKYESEKKEQQISLLEKDKALQTSELERNQKELVLQQLESEHNRQRAQLLFKQHEIQQLQLVFQSTELELKTKALTLQKTENEKKEKDILFLSKDRELQASIIDREMIIRNAMIVGLLLILLIGVLGFKRLAGRKRELALRTEAAEYKAKAAEAHAFELRAETERKEKEAQNTFTKKLITSQENERKRVAGALHDSVGQDLLILQNLALQMLEHERLDSTIAQKCNQLSSLLTATLQDMRHVSLDLHPYHLEQIGLTGTLKLMMRTLAETSKIEIHSTIDDIDALFTQENEINVYRVVQECFNNILKHSNASTARIDVVKTESSVQIRIHDNGKGFEAFRYANGELSGGLGLKGMHERVQMLGGTLHVDSSQTKGTVIEVCLPQHENSIA